MKRFMFALGLLATVAVAESEGAYLVIRIVLESGSLEPAATPGGPNGAGGSPPPIGSPGVGGGPKGGGSSLGPPPGGPGPMGNGPKGGGSSLGPPPGGPMGPKGGGSSLGPPPAGSGTNLGAGSGMAQSGGNAPAGGGIKNDPTRSLYVVVPYTNDIEKQLSFYKKAPPQSQNPNWRPAIKHAYGQANLMFDNVSIQLYADIPNGTKNVKWTRHEEILDRRAKLGMAPDGQQLLDLIADSLKNGFVADAHKYTDELAAAVAAKKSQATPQVERFLTAWDKMKDDVLRPSRAPSDGPAWRDRINIAYTGVRDYGSPHYHVFYWEGMDREMNRRVVQLEDNFKAFFLMHAVKGVMIPVPEKPQLVILARSSGDVRKLSAALDGTSAVADGFFCPDHGIVVLSPERLDAVSQTFNRQIQDMFRQGVGRDQLIVGDGPKIDARGLVKDSKKPEDVARMMTWVTAERFAEEEGEWSAVSREATRQLLHATGLLPQHVSLPLWLSEGSANYYHRPKGPVFTRVADKDVITVAPTTGYGGTNYVRQKQFNELVKHGQFIMKDKTAVEHGQVLKNVLTDAYFAASVAGLDADNLKFPLPPVPPKATGPMVGAPAAAPPEDPIVVKRRRADFLNAKAQATAWSLYYFLASDANAAGLQRYLAELGRQPRDLPLDESTRITTFANAFNIALDGKKTGNQMTLDEFGAAWFRFLATMPQEGIDITLQDLTAPSGGTNTGGPGGAGPGPGLGGAGGSLGPKPGM